MRAMILAAGRGKRMQPLTDSLPKPLLTVKGRSLIAHHLKSLVRAGITEVVINVGHLGHKIEEALGNGAQYELAIQYSYEDPILETGGGVYKALPLLGPDPFIVISGDVLTDYPLEKCPKNPRGLGHLVMVDNPPYHPLGDFALVDGWLQESGGPLLNFAGIGVYHPEMFTECPRGAFPLSLLFKRAIRDWMLSGEYYQGLWHNIGTPEQLAELNA